MRRDELRSESASAITKKPAGEGTGEKEYRRLREQQPANVPLPCPQCAQERKLRQTTERAPVHRQKCDEDGDRQKAGSQDLPEILRLPHHRIERDDGLRREEHLHILLPLVHRKKLHRFLVALRYDEKRRHFLLGFGECAMRFPHIGNVCQDRCVIRPFHGSKDPDHLQGMRVSPSLRTRAMHGVEGIPYAKSGKARRLAPNDDLPFLCKASSFRDGKPWALLLIRAEIKNSCARPGDAKAPVIIPEGERIHRLRARIGSELLHIVMGDISDRLVPKEYRIQHQLVRGTLRSDKDRKRRDRTIDAIIEPARRLQQKYRQRTGECDQKEQDQPCERTADE